MHPILWIIALVGLIVLFRWLNRMPKANRARMKNRILLTLAIGLGIFLMIRGLHPLLAAVGALLPLLPRLLGAVQTISNLRSLFGAIPGFRQGPTPNIETHWIRMMLNPGTGAMEGEVLAGCHQGHRLSQLALGQLLEVLAELQGQDGYSATILEAYLDRMHSGWRQGYAGATGSYQNAPAYDQGQISITDAYQILGLDPGASRKDIVTAHRKLIQKLHPDRGGSTFLATQINRAKDRLLEHVS